MQTFETLSCNVAIIVKHLKGLFACLHCRGSGEQTWYAQLLLLFAYTDTNGCDHDAAFVRWFKAFGRRPKHATSCKLKLLKWEVHKPRGMQPGPRTDVIKLHQIIGPCYIQQDPVNADLYYYNHWIGNTIDSE